jgi:hypothetical protein
MDEVCKILELEGVKVVRPEIIDWSKDIKTPHFEAKYSDIMIILNCTEIFRT